MGGDSRGLFTAAFKRQVILFTESTNNGAAERNFDVSEKVIRMWRKQREAIFNCSGLRRCFRGPKSGNFPSLEEKLKSYVIELRTRSLPVTCEMVHLEARRLASEEGIPRSAFKASQAWK